MNDRITVAQWMEDREREWLDELALAHTRYCCEGFALAWANHRAKQRPRSKIAAHPEARDV